MHSALGHHVRGVSTLQQGDCQCQWHCHLERLRRAGARTSCRPQAAGRCACFSCQTCSRSDRYCNALMQQICAEHVVLAHCTCYSAHSRYIGFPAACHLQSLVLRWRCATVAPPCACTGARSQSCAEFSVQLAGFAAGLAAAVLLASAPAHAGILDGAPLAPQRQPHLHIPRFQGEITHSCFVSAKSARLACARCSRAYRDCLMRSACDLSGPVGHVVMGYPTAL